MEEKFSVEITPEGREMLKSKGIVTARIKGIRVVDGTGPSERETSFFDLFSYLLIFTHPTLKCVESSDLFPGLSFEDNSFPSSIYTKRTFEFYMTGLQGTLAIRYYHSIDKKWINYKYSLNLGRSLLKRSPYNFFKILEYFVDRGLYSDDTLALTHSVLAKHPTVIVSGGPWCEVELGSLSWGKDFLERKDKMEALSESAIAPEVIKVTDFGTLSFEPLKDAFKDTKLEFEAFQKDL